MQSVHVYKVQTHFQVFVFFLESCLLEGPKWSHIEVVLNPRAHFCEKKCIPETVSKIDSLPDPNYYLFHCQEAPREAASRAQGTDKNQLFEQQLKPCSRFLQKKVDCAQRGGGKLTGLLNCCKKTEWIAENC